MSHVQATEFTEHENAVLTARGVPTHRHVRVMLFDAWKRTGLDPFTGQIYAANRQNTFKIETTIDGMRTIAEKHGRYAGQDGPYWCGPDGVWVDVWLQKEPPVAAKIGIMRSDFAQPLYATARFTDFAARKKDGSLNPFWFKMGPHMIAKVAEALALRRAFPQDLSGLYTSDEMQQSEPVEDEPVRQAPPQLTRQQSITGTPAPAVQGMADEAFQKILAKAIREESTRVVVLGLYKDAKHAGASPEQLDQLVEIGREKAEAEAEITDKEIRAKMDKIAPVVDAELIEDDDEDDIANQVAEEDTGRKLYAKARAALDREA